MNDTVLVMIRGTIGFFSLLIFTKVLGKQQVSELSLFEYVLGITIGSSAATLTTEIHSSAWPHWVALFIWSLLVFLLQVITSKSEKISNYIDGKPELIVIEGKILEHTMKKMRYSINDLMEQLRNNGVFDVKDVQFAILENNGKLSILKKSSALIPTRSDFDMPDKKQYLGVNIIVNGILIEENLKKINKTIDWVYQQLSTNNIKFIKDVYYGRVQKDGSLYFDLFEDHIQGGKK